MNRMMMDLIREELETGAAGVLCTVVEEVGSTPRSLGACMWVRPDGGILGTVGGGVLEYHVIQEALGMLGKGPEYRLFREALHCNGVAEGETLDWGYAASGGGSGHRRMPGPAPSFRDASSNSRGRDRPCCGGSR